MRLAIAVDEKGQELFEGHFGDAPFFLIYSLKTEGMELLKRMKNETPEEAFHGDLRKFEHIKALLNDVDVLVARKMGPNVRRVLSSKFKVVISRELLLKDMLAVFHRNAALLEEGKAFLLEGQELRKVQ